MIYIVTVISISPVILSSIKMSIRLLISPKPLGWDDQSVIVTFDTISLTNPVPSNEVGLRSLLFPAVTL